MSTLGTRPVLAASAAGHSVMCFCPAVPRVERPERPRLLRRVPDFFKMSEFMWRVDYCRCDYFCERTCKNVCEVLLLTVLKKMRCSNTWEAEKQTKQLDADGVRGCSITVPKILFALPCFLCARKCCSAYMTCVLEAFWASGHAIFARCIA